MPHFSGRWMPPLLLALLISPLSLFGSTQTKPVCLPNPLLTAAGEPILTKDQWQLRRKEIRSILEQYATGHQPPAPSNLSAQPLSEALLCEGKVRFQLFHLSFGEAGKLGFDVALYAPTRYQGPLPAIINPSFDATPGAVALPVLPRPPGQGKGVDAMLPVAPLPSAVPGPSPLKARSPEQAARTLLPVLERGYLVLTYHYQDTGEDTTLRLSDGSWAFRTTRFFPAYPGCDWGLLGAWAWGVSRCVDFLQSLPTADASHLAAIGHSRLGKAVLIAGAFDERLAAILPVGSGAGGAQAYRFCGLGHGGREGLDIELQKYPNWFPPALYPFRGHTDRLPFDQHWFLALTAPRPLLALEGTADTNCSPEALRQAINAAAPAYAMTGADPLSLAAHYAPHPHSLDAGDWAAAVDFLDLHFKGLDRGRSWNNYPTAPLNQRLNVRDFGALGDGHTKDTGALQSAIDRCATTGGGEVLLPAGTYLSGSLELKSDTTLRLEKDSILQGSPDLADYPLENVRWEGRWTKGHRGLLYASKASRIAVVGEGVIRLPDSLGGRELPRRPALVEPVDCTDVRLEDFNASYQRMWGLHPTLCDDVIVRNIRIRSTGGNSDGIDIDSCRRVLIEGCDIEAGDDCIALKSGRGMEGWREARPTSEVLIRDCVLADHGYACIGIGSESSGGIRGVRIERCRFTFAKTFAIYIKSRPGRGAFIEDISGEDLIVSTKPGGFLRINLLKSGIQDPEPVPGEEGLPLGRRFSFKNIQVDCGALLEATETLSEKPVEDLRMENIRGTCTSGIHAANIKGLSIKAVQVEGLNGPLLTSENVATAP